MFTLKSISFVAVMPLMMITVQSIIFEVHNDFGSDIWIGIMGQSPPVNPSSYKLNASDVLNITVNDIWIGGNIWARTYCNDTTHTCLTGSCSGDESSCKDGGIPPTTIFEYTKTSNSNPVTYTVSLVNGANINIYVEPIESFVSAGCEPINCTFDWSHCPNGLTLSNTQGEPIGCKSACFASNQPEYCCTGPKYNTSSTCTAPLDKNTNYFSYFRNSCPNGNIYAFDPTSFQCRNVLFFKIIFS